MIDPFGLAEQFSVALGGSAIAPGAGTSLYGVLGVNVDGWNSTLYVQGIASAGTGGGAFVGYGISFNGGEGDSPSSGTAVTNYIEGDAGCFIAGGASANMDDCGNVVSKSAAVPYKVGEGYGVGAFVGKSASATGVTPTIEEALTSILGIAASVLSGGDMGR